MSERRIFAAPPEVIRWVPRTDGHGDCAVAAIEIACGVTYEVALSAALHVCPHVLTEGLNWPEIKRAVKHLGITSRILRRYDLDDSTGILCVQQPHVEDSSHVVYLWEGRIIEPMNARQQLWLSARDFLSHYKYTAEQLMVLSREDK